MAATNGSLSPDKIELSGSEMDILLGFFKYFRIPNAPKIAEKIAKLGNIRLANIPVDIIRNNVYKQEAVGAQQGID